MLEAIPDGRGVHMIDGKMQDDATWKQCKVMVNLAEMLAHKDPELAEAYGFDLRRPLGLPLRMRFFEYESREIVEARGDPRHRLRLHDRARGGEARSPSASAARR